MKRIFSRSLLLLLLLTMTMATHAQSSGSTVNAATCNQADVNAVINGPTHTAVNGDTIKIPAGSCTWSSGVNITGVGISIIGSGTPNSLASQTGASSSCSTGTNITSSNGNALFVSTGLTYGQFLRVSCMDWITAPLGSSDVPLRVIASCTSSGCPNLRVDNIYFDPSWGTVPLPAEAITITANAVGVYDHNTLNGVQPIGRYLVDANQGAWLGVGQFGDNSWASPDTTGTGQAMYLENNQFNTSQGIDNDEADTFTNTGGGRFVCRFNTFTNPPTSSAACGGHGTASGGRLRGMRQMEVYGNTITTTAAVFAPFGFNSGTGYVWGNTFSTSGSGYFNNFLALTPQRAFYGPDTPWGICDGTGGWDQNDGVVYATGTVTASGTNTFSDSSKSWTTNQWVGPAGSPYSVHDVTQGFGSQITGNSATQYSFSNAPISPGTWTWQVGDSYQILRATVCLDQPGRGAETYLSGGASPPATPTPAGWPSEALDPIYEWEDTLSGSYSGGVLPYTPSMLLNRDYYSESTNQAVQTSPTSPFNGLSGSGHGTLANRPTTCTTGVGYFATDQGSWNSAGPSGELFKCTATNTWTLAYTPYTYPHPLESGSSTATTVPPPLNVTGTVVN